MIIKKTNMILLASLIAVIAIIPTVTAANYITEEYLVSTYDKSFTDTDVTREDKIAIMDNILNTVPFTIPANEERTQMIEKVSALMEKRDSLVDDPKAQAVIDKTINGMKMAMAKLGLTMMDDYDAQNEWYDLAHQYASENAHTIPEPEKRFELIPEADASSHWNVQHKLDHSCGSTMCSNAWNDYVDTVEYSHISVIIDTVEWPYTINSWQTADNLSWTFRTATTQGWATLVSGSTIELDIYKTVGWAFVPWESNTWSMLSDQGTLEENDVYYSTIKITT